MRRVMCITERGFTVMEILVAMALSLVLMAGIFRTFKSQQDSYVVQDQVAAMQQNLRGAMYLLTRDIQMAGYYTNAERKTHAMDWDDLDNDNNTTTATEAIRTLIFGRTNVNAVGDEIKDNTDLIVIIKAGAEGRALTAGEGASSTTGRITLNDFDLDGDGTVDLNTSGKKFGILVKQDLHTADFFEVNSTTSPIIPPGGLADDYEQGDLIYRADIIIYRVSDEDPGRPCLVRKNLGSNNNHYEVVAENIDNMQIRYQLNDGTWVDNPAGNQARVRAVQIFLLARTANTQRGYRDTNMYNLPGDNQLTNPNDSYRRKLFSSIVKTRNIGL